MKNNKTYVLGMFPYPSGDGLHVGHVRIYTAVDVLARYFRLKGQEVLCPIGWDAFGLPAENAAIKKKTIPQKVVPTNYNNFRKQMQNLSLSFDWEREFATTDPSYYGLTQWIFLELYKKGLVYREQVPINWCPKCKTGLANEEVLPDGTHERCGEITGKKELPQWVMKITDYAEELLNDLDIDLGVEEPKLDKSRKALDWPRGILEMQRNWIGKKEGIEIDFEVVGHEEKITVFTTAPVNWGASFMVLAPEHKLIKKIIANELGVEEEIVEKLKAYVKQAGKKTEIDRMEEGRDKTGAFAGIYVKNHVTGESLPVWVSDFVLANFGTGAIQACPGHDQRDFEFAKKFGLPIPRVVVGEDGDESPIERVEQVVDKSMPGKMVNSDFITGLSFEDGLEKTKDYFEEKGWGRRVVTYHLRDWVFSRQRYWGEPIPLVHCDECGVQPLSERELPLTLPELESYEPTDTGESPLSRVEEWVSTTCPKCGKEARRETDTMPNWAGSCWYHLAFSFWRSENSDNQKTQNVSKSDNQKSTKQILEGYKNRSERPFSEFWQEVAQPEIEKWLPVDWYLGGAEHAVLHLLYARFWNKVLYDLGHLSFPEPYLRLRSVGMVLAEDNRKMSKSWGNVINPDDVVRQYGSDAVRLYEMFMGPWNQAIAWDTRALVGQQRFLQRVERTFEDKERIGEETSPELAVQLAKLIEQVERGIIEQKFNTSIAGMMELVNSWRNNQLVMSKEEGKKLAIVMSPFAPKMAQKNWERCGGITPTGKQLGRQGGRVEESEWPSMEVESLGEAQDLPVTIAVQVNGKLRSTINVARSTSMNEEEVMKVVMGDSQVQKWVKDREPKKVIFVPGKLVNLVV